MTLTFIEIVIGDPDRKARFIDLFKNGADLMISYTNLAEIVGTQGKYIEDIKDLLNSIGSHWFPVEMNPLEVVERENSGLPTEAPCISKQFIKVYFEERTNDAVPGSGKVIDLSDDFYKLGLVIDWIYSHRESILSDIRNLDEALTGKILKYREESEKNPQWLENEFPAVTYNRLKPATFVYFNLIRNLILEAKHFHLKKNDGADFCHAVMAGAYASCATLDKHWKRRIEHLPKPNGIAKIFYSHELDIMIDEIEAFIKTINARTHPEDI